MTIGQLFQKHGSDKSWHGYDPIYEQYLAPLRHHPVRLLEIGILGGASLRAWSEYFVNPLREIWGIDHNAEALKSLSAEERLRDNIRVYAQDATYRESWDAIESLCEGKRFDVICDDGAHAVWAQYQAFIHGWRLLKPGGIWLIEDVHASFDAAYRRDNLRNGLPESTTIHDLIAEQSRRRLHEFGDSQCGRFTTVESDLEFVHYHKSLIVLRKRLTSGAVEYPQGGLAKNQHIEASAPEGLL